MAKKSQIQKFRETGRAHRDMLASSPLPRDNGSFYDQNQAL
jgi:hypothetical protein